jgi:hypothetical protein
MKAIIVFLLIIIFHQYVIDTCYEYFNTTRITSNIDGRTYKVLSIYGDENRAADIIAELNKFAFDVIRSLKKYNDANIDKIYDFGIKEEYLKGKDMYNILIHRFNPNAVSENEPENANTTSYTTNKGEIISLCLREKQSGKNKFHSIDVLKFVFLHELAHIVTPEYQHTDVFWNNFRFLLDFTEKENLYVSKDYAKQNELYCGINIKYNPIYDNNRTVSFFR